MVLIGDKSQHGISHGPNSPVTILGPGATQHIGETTETAERRHREQLAGMDALRVQMEREKGIEPEKLLPIFAHLGELGLPLDQVRARAEEAIAAILEQARRPHERTNDGADIDATINAARDRLQRLDTAGALDGLAAKIAEEDAARRQRLLPLLREKADIERKTYDYPAARATLAQLLTLAPDEVAGWGDLGEVWAVTGPLGNALAAYRNARAAAERRLRVVPDNPTARRDLSVSHDRIGDVQRAQGDLAAALTSYQASHRIFERLAQADPGNADWQRDLSVSHERIGDVQQAQGDLAAALTSYRASVAIRERLAQADPGNAGWQRDLSVSNERIGDLHNKRGELALAIAAFERALDSYRQLQRRNPADIVSLVSSVVPLWRLGRLRGRKGRADFEAALAILKPLAAADRLDANRRNWIESIQNDVAATD